MQIQPDDVADLALQLRVGGELERLRPHGCTPKRCQIRAMVACEIGDPSAARAAASSREDQWAQTPSRPSPGRVVTRPNTADAHRRISTPRFRSRVDLPTAEPGKRSHM